MKKGFTLVIPVPITSIPKKTQHNMFVFVGIRYLALLSRILGLFLSNFQCSSEHVNKLICFLQPDTDPYQVPVNTILLGPV